MEKFEPTPCFNSFKNWTFPLYEEDEGSSNYVLTFSS